MRITPINYQKNYTSCLRTYTKPIDKFTNMEINTTTWLFRQDMDWVQLVKKMQENFRNCSKINIYSAGASDGSEAYTMAIALLEYAPELAKKSFPIFASDQDDEMIKTFNTGRINLRIEDFIRMEMFTNKNFFIDGQEKIEIQDLQNSPLNKNARSFRPIPEIANSIFYKKEDIIETLNNIEDNGNTLLLCRNVSSYLSKDTVEKLCESAEKTLKKGSLFAVGFSDFLSGLPYKLPKYRFKEIIPDMLFEKL